MITSTVSGINSLRAVIPFKKEQEISFLSTFHCMLFAFFWQQLRKLLLEILHRIPTNEHLRPHFQVSTMYDMIVQVG